MAMKIFKIRDGQRGAVYAKGEVGKQAEAMLEKVGRSKYAAVRGVRPTITAEHVKVTPPKELKDAFTGLAPKAGA